MYVSYDLFKYQSELYKKKYYVKIKKILSILPSTLNKVRVNFGNP